MWNIFRHKTNNAVAAQGILPKHLYLELVRKAALIESMVESSCSPSSYELRIRSFYNPSDQSSREMVKGDVISVPSGGVLHFATIEKVDLPLDIMGLMYLRSTLARRGCLSWFQGLVDPGFRGHLTIVVHNLTGDPIEFKYEDRVCHIVFHRLAEAAQRPYSGVYQDNLGALAGPPTSGLVGYAPLLEPATLQILANPKVIDALNKLAES